MRDEGFVYMVLNPEGTAAKIGFTSNPVARLAQMQSANDRLLVMEFAIPASKEVETDLHRRFAGSRVRLEWFSDVEDIGEAFCKLEQEYADRQLATMFYGSTIDPALTTREVEAALG